MPLFYRRFQFIVLFLANYTKYSSIQQNSVGVQRSSDVMTQTNKLEWWMILKISLRAKAGVPKTLVKRKLRQHSLCFPAQNTLMLTESCEKFSNLHSILR